MTIAQFALLVTRQEGLKKQVNIAQVKEILKVVNAILNGKLYALIREAKTS